MRARVRIAAEINYDADLMYGDDEESKNWFLNYLLKRGRLDVFSSELGDVIGTLKILSIEE